MYDIINLRQQPQQRTTARQQPECTIGQRPQARQINGANGSSATTAAGALSECFITIGGQTRWNSLWLEMVRGLSMAVGPGSGSGSSALSAYRLDA